MPKPQLSPRRSLYLEHFQCGGPIIGFTDHNILANAENIKKPSVRESIIRNAEKLKRNYKIIKLGSTAPLPFSLREMGYVYTGLTTNEVLKGIGLK